MKIFALFLVLCAAGCASVHPWQRERLASPAMQFEMAPFANAQQDSVLEITEGSTFFERRSWQCRSGLRLSLSSLGKAGGGAVLLVLAAVTGVAQAQVGGQAPIRWLGTPAVDEAPSNLDEPVPATTDPAPVTAEPEPAAAPDTSIANSATANTGALRAGIYSDTDQTTVYRTLAAIASTWGSWSLSANAAVDIVTSASIDVRSSPQLSRVDVITSASGTTSRSGGKMSDRRIQVGTGAGWKDGQGHAVNLSATGAAETDYDSVSGGINGSTDLNHRNTTLLGGMTYTDNWIRTVLDSSFHRKMHEVGWSAGIAQVLTTKDALRLRYDGSLSQGYQASPYRNVRFGNWSTTLGDNNQFIFHNTLGSADGLPESEPDNRTRHAVVLEWVHSLSDNLGLHTEGRLARDSWGVQGETAAMDLRLAEPSWRLQLGYRFYLQSAASFFQDKYTSAATAYPYYSSDKELGDQVGHMLNLDLSAVLKAPRHEGDSRLLLDAKIAGMYYTYPNFALLPSRAGAFLELGLTWEL